MQADAGEKGQREVGADPGLGGVGDQGDAAGDDAGSDGDHAFDDVPAHGEVLQPQGTTMQRPAALQGQGLGHAASSDGPAGGVVAAVP